MIDQSTEFGRRVADHLRDEIVVWLTTVAPSGSPVPSPVWFLWDGEESVTVYSQPGARARNIAANPRVTLNFGGNGRGGDIVILSGTAELGDEAPPVSADPEYLAKYDSHIARVSGDPEAFAAKYSVPVRIQLTGVRGH